MKNHLFIGLGGQGGKSIAELRKVFESRSKDVEKLTERGTKWDFLYIDSSLDVSNERSNWVYYGKDLKLESADFLSLKGNEAALNARSMSSLPFVAPWIGDVSLLQGFIEGGAGGIPGANQRRRLGRLLFASKADQIRKAVCEDKVTPMLENRNECVFHIFASLAGGTGSGGIVDLVTMIRTEFDDPDVDNGFPIFLYLYVTDREFTDAQVGYFHENQAAAIRDLNALIVGKLHPTLLGSAMGASTFSRGEPISQILLSSHLSGSNQLLSLSGQHQIVAEAVFERIYSYSSGDLNTTQQKAITGEDKLGSYPGEPSINVSRSFRFGSVGMRRWEVPIEQTRELLMRDLAVSCYNRLLYNNWNEKSGFSDQGIKSSSSISGYEETLSALRVFIDSKTVVENELPGLKSDLKSDFDAFYIGKVRSRFGDDDLDHYEVELRKRYRSSLRGQGVDSIFTEFSLNRVERLKEIRAKFHHILRDACTQANTPLGLDYVNRLLVELQDRIRKRLNETEKPVHDDEVLQNRMVKRRVEWDKMTVLSRPFRQKQLAHAHQEDLRSILTSDLRKRSEEEDSKLFDALVGEIGQLASDYQKAAKQITVWRDKAKDRRDRLHQDLKTASGGASSGSETIVANKMELSIENLDSHLRDQALEENLIASSSQELLQGSILSTLGNGQITQLPFLSELQSVELDESADSVLFKRAEGIHDSIRRQKNREPLLSGSVLEILRRRFSQNKDGFMKELQEFIASATCNVLLASGETQPRTLRGAKGMPSMPRMVLIVGLPRAHVFTDTIRKMIKKLMSAGDETVVGTYEHDDETQIRMLSMMYWTAARFMTVVQRLDAMYTESLKNSREGDISYFTNIDDSGEKGSRPSLLLPSHEEMRESLDAALWLGVRIYLPNSAEKLLQEEEDELMLVQRTEEGVASKGLGKSKAGLLQAADVNTINLICGSVEDALSELEEQEKIALREEVKAEDARLQKELGATTTEFAKWVKQRARIYRFLSK